jgi:citrate lyase subunit beta / citryl-CoA lyase
MNRLRSWSDRRPPETPADVTLLRSGDALLRASPGVRLAIPVSAIDAPGIEAELDALAAAAPWAIVARRCHSGADIQRLGVKLAVREARFGVDPGSIGIACFVGDSPAGLLQISSFVGASSRLVALIADSSAPHADFARSLVVLAAAAAGVAAILGPRSGPFNRDGVRAEAEVAAAEGFVGRIAVTPEEVEIYNSAFAASAAKPPAASSRA